jgi:large subunit ribosomal protein L15
MRTGFEGGQLPIIKRLPEKRGFVNLFGTRYSLVNLSQLSVLRKAPRSTPRRCSRPADKSLSRPVKVLGTGELTASSTSRPTSFPPRPKKNRGRRRQG